MMPVKHPIEYTWIPWEWALIEFLAVGFVVFFVISVYAFSFWPRKRDEGINTPSEEE